MSDIDTTKFDIKDYLETVAASGKQPIPPATGMMVDHDKDSIIEDDDDSGYNNEASKAEYCSQDVLDWLKKSLSIHWEQTTVLSAQAVHLERWGYSKLAAIIKEDAMQEHQHAMINLARLEFFNEDYQPLLVSPPVWTRGDISALIQYNLDSVRKASWTERQTILAARATGDEMTANIMIPLLQGSEDGIALYMGYQRMIEQMGLDNFLSLQA